MRNLKDIEIECPSADLRKRLLKIPENKSGTLWRASFVLPAACAVLLMISITFKKENAVNQTIDETVVVESVVDDFFDEVIDDDLEFFI